MQYRRFGRTNEQVSAMGFGTWPMSGDRYGAIEIDQAVKAIQAAIDAGVNCVDTAPAYGSGHSETAVARALKGRRDKVLLVTKCGINRKPAALRMMQSFLLPPQQATDGCKLAGSPAPCDCATGACN